MNCFLIQAILIADVGDEENSFWMQALVFLLLAVSWWVHSLVSKKRNEFKEQQRIAEETGTCYTKPRGRFRLPRKHIALCKDIVQKYITKTRDIRFHIRHLPREPVPAFDSPEPATERNRDLQSGMELLELDFLVSIVENTKGNGQNDVTMRKLDFNEILRRGSLRCVNSEALKVYAVNKDNLYDKHIQCEAMGELAERTSHKSGQKPLQPALPVSL